MIDCGAPLFPKEVFVNPFNNTKLNAVITYEYLLATVCSSNNNNYSVCKFGNTALIFILIMMMIIHLSVSCGAQTTLANGHIIDYSSGVEGSKVTFHCDTNSALITSICSSNGSWIPDPTRLDCELFFCFYHEYIRRGRECHTLYCRVQTHFEEC